MQAVFANYSSMASEIERLLTGSSLTAPDVAKLVGVSRATVYNWMEGTKPNSRTRAQYELAIHKIKEHLSTGTTPGLVNFGYPVPELEVMTPMWSETPRKRIVG